MTTFEIDTRAISLLADDLNGQAKSAPGKARNIVKRGAAEIREHWHATATQFPSPTLARKENYDISYAMSGTNANTAQAIIGSPDRLLAVIEYGSVNHSPHLFGSDALDKALPGVVQALGWITDLSVKS